MNKHTATTWRAGIVLSLAATAMTGTAVTQAGPGCMNDQRHAMRGHYPYSPMGPQAAYGRPVPYGYYGAPAAGMERMAPHYKEPKMAQRYKSSAPSRPASAATAKADPRQRNVATVGSGQSATGDDVTVRINGMRFEPAQLTVKPGTTVTWIHESRMPHTVTGKAGEIRSDTLNRRQQFSHTFDSAGSYEYACDFHPSMQGSVIVEADGIGT